MTQASLLLACFALLSALDLAQSEPFTIGIRDDCDPELLTLGQPKIENLRLNSARHEDVRWLYVTMNYSLRVCSIHRVCNLNAQIEHGFDLQRFASDPYAGASAPPAVPSKVANTASICLNSKQTTTFCNFPLVTVPGRI